VCGTDTAAGKTFVASAVARLWRRQGRAFRVCKPVATGALWQGGRWLAEDTRLLAEAAGEEDLEAVTPWAFPEPAAPPVAARAAGTELSLADLVAAVRRRADALPAQAARGAVLVEGVGGLLCPLTERETVADLARELGLPLVVVARRSLGTLNHTLLTVEAALRRGLRVAGVVVSETAPPQGLAERTNVEELRRRLSVPLLAVVPHQPGANVPALEAVDWWGLAEVAQVANLPHHPGRSRDRPGTGEGIGRR
jgi:dethiobiotin synthetase